MKRLYAVLFTLLFTLATNAQTTAFTYQGKLNDGLNPATGAYLLQFTLWNAPVGGDQVGGTLTDVSVMAANGIFTTHLDFGEAAFDSADLFIEISVRRNVVESYTLLAPRQPVTSAPYAVRARNAYAAFDSARLGGTDASRFVKDDSPALTDARDPLPGSGSYIQNGTTEQSSADFNISGEGKASVLTAASHFKIADDTVLKVESNGTTKVGVGAGNVNIGANNAFFGYQAGLINPTGQGNSFFGYQAGLNSATSNNSFFGFASGKSSNPGANNAFFGSEAGVNNFDGDANSFFGRAAGTANIGGDQNTYIGAFSGGPSSGNFGVTLLGALAEASGGNLTNATAIGASAVVSQSNSVILGNNANVGIGTSAPQSKLTVVGLIETTSGGVRFPDGTTQTTALTTSSAILNQTTLQTGNFNISGTGTADILRANTQFNLGSVRFLSGLGTRNTFLGQQSGTANTGTDNTFLGYTAGQDNAGGSDNTMVGSGAGRDSVSGIRNVFVGRSAGYRTLSGLQNVAVGMEANTGEDADQNGTSVGFQAGQLSSGDANTLIGSNAGRSTVGEQNTFIGRNSGDSLTGNFNTALGAATGTTILNASYVTLLGYGSNLGANNLSNATAIGAGATVNTSNTIALGRSDGSDKVRIFGLGAAGSTALCRNANNEIATCSSSLRYKHNIEPFFGGLDLIRRLKPIMFDWNQTGEKDLGLGAEDVAEVSELLVHRNQGGEVEGVKYDRITIILLNAVKEQQVQIESLKREIEALKREKGGQR